VYLAFDLVFLEIFGAFEASQAGTGLEPVGGSNVPLTGARQ
jgi:hypothetical protein